MNLISEKRVDSATERSDRVIPARLFVDYALRIVSERGTQGLVTAVRSSLTRFKPAE